MAKISLDFMPEIEVIPEVRHLYNVGALLDIPTGIYLPGRMGESILNGGMGMLTGVVGRPNTFKSAEMDYMAMSAMSAFPGTFYGVYDTEINKTAQRLAQLSKHIDALREVDLIGEKMVRITDKTQLSATEWYEKVKEQMAAKVKHRKDILIELPFATKSGVPLMVPLPTYQAVDSLSEFVTDDVEQMQDENELGDSGANTMHMRQGAAKTRFLSDVIRRASESNTAFLMSAHVGQVIGMDPRSPPPKQLQFLKNGDVIKGVSSKFLYLTTVCWQTVSSTLLINDGTKAAEYPKEQGSGFKGETDLNLVTLSTLRNKNGPSGGAMIQHVVSQQEGVLPALSEFHYIKSADRYGLEGSLQNYTLTLLPGVTLSRTKVREKIDSDPKLRRAIRITSELLQINLLYNYLDEELYCDPKQLYEGIKAKGYDWDILLNSRGNWCADHYDQPIPYLSTMDLMKMRVGRYHPFWLAADKKTVLKPSEYKKYTA